MKTQTKTMIVLMFALMLIGFASADTITPGYEGISIKNYITNINDFPDYVFFSGSKISSDEKVINPGYGMCPVREITEDGLIAPYYKFCTISVYAIKKSDLNKDLFEKLQNEDYIDNKNHSEIQKEYITFLTYTKEIITAIEIYKEVPTTGSTKGITNEYTIDINSLKTEPDNRIIKRDYPQIIIYCSVSIIALLSIILILRRRR